MEHPTAEEAAKLFERAQTALAAGEIKSALALLEKALKEHDNPPWYSYLGYCIAKERGQVKKGIELCRTSLEAEPENPAHYLNLGNIHLLNRQKAEALEALRQGMAVGGSPGIEARLKEIGTRKPPVFKSLPRNHPLNRYLGLILGRLRLR